MLSFRRSRSAQRGVATLEFHIVSLLAMLPIGLGTIQIALLLVANHYVDFAAFAAARVGASSGALQHELEQAFLDSLMPLLVDVGDGVNRDTVVARVAAARLRAATEGPPFSWVELLAPGADVQADFAVDRDGQSVIPNDSLRSRSERPGARSGKTLQQANVLVLAATWCHPLVVPFAREMLVGVMRRLDPEPRNQLCYASMRMPIQARGIAPMQSDFVIR